MKTPQPPKKQYYDFSDSLKTEFRNELEIFDVEFIA